MKVMETLSLVEICLVFCYDARCAIVAFLPVPLIAKRKVKGQHINSNCDYHTEGHTCYFF